MDAIQWHWVNSVSCSCHHWPFLELFRCPKHRPLKKALCTLKFHLPLCIVPDTHCSTPSLWICLFMVTTYKWNLMFILLWLTDFIWHNNFKGHLYCSMYCSPWFFFFFIFFWLEKMLYVISFSLKFLRPVVSWLNVSRILEKTVYSSVVGWGVLWISVQSLQFDIKDSWIHMKRTFTFHFNLKDFF